MERRDPAVHISFDKMEGSGEMIKAPISLQDLRRKIYIKAKAEPSHRFWGLYVHVCKKETLYEAYYLAKANNGAPGIDAVTFKDIESQGVGIFIEQIRQELITGTYQPMRVRKVEIPKDGNKVRVLSVPSIRDRVVQGALKLILEPIFEADFQAGSYGYRPKRSAHKAIERVSEAIVQSKTYVIDLDLRSYFDTVRHDILLKKVAQRIDDDEVMRLLKMIIRATGKKGVPQGGVISPLLSNVYLNEVDKMLERAKKVTSCGRWTAIEYARFADDLVVLIDSHPKHARTIKLVRRRLREEINKLGVEINEYKSKEVDLAKGQSFGYLGFQFHRIRSIKGRWMPLRVPQSKKRSALTRKLKDIFRSYESHSVEKLIVKLNRILKGWVDYFRVGHSSKCFSFIRDWVEKKVRRHLMRSRKRRGFGWKRWSKQWLYEKLGLYSDYRIQRITALSKAAST